MPVKVLIVDDSALIRKVLTDMLASDEDLTVVGTANDGGDALQKIDSLKPDVVTLDIEMPNLNGLDCLKQIMKRSPLPVIMVSYLTLQGAETTIKALEMGAVDFVTKPSAQETDYSGLETIRTELISKIKTAAGIVDSKLKNNPATLAVWPETRRQRLFPAGKVFKQDLIAIGASTGGPKALYYLLPKFPKDFPVGIIIAQHMPKDFTAVFARRLNELCALEITEAKTGDAIAPGKALIAPSGYQTKVVRTKDSLIVEVTEEPKLILKPSADFLFKSIAESCPGRSVSILLTGMGADGAQGMKLLRDFGGRTIAQDEESCIVYGMPRAALEMGGVEFVEGLTTVYDRIISILNE